MNKEWNSNSKLEVYTTYKRYAYNMVKEINTKIAETNKNLVSANKVLYLYRSLLKANKTNVNYLYNIKIEDLDLITSKVKFEARKYVLLNNTRAIVESINKSARKKLDNETAIYINDLMQQFYDIKYNVSIIEDNISFLNNIKLRYEKVVKISREAFYYIISEINKYYEQLLIFGETIYLGYGLGTVKVLNIRLRPSEKVNERIDFGETMKYRKMLKDKGIPVYSKKEHLKAIEEGIEYNNKKYFVYYTNDSHPYVVWVSPYGLVNRKNFTFVPTSHNYTGISLLDLRKQEVEDILDMNLGLRCKIVAICHKDRYHNMNYRTASTNKRLALNPSL